MATAREKERQSDLIILVLRLVIGAFLVYHGVEIFSAEKMQGYFSWMPELIWIKPSVVAYIGKALEFITGLMLILGLFVRIAAVVIIIIFLFISFKLGDGRIFMEEQHPFMFVLFGLLFLVEGARRWSADYYIKDLRQNRRP